MYKLLIIEDETDIRENIKEIFELNGYEVYTSANGSEGIKLALKYNPDIILCDIMMPIMDGLEVKQALGKKKQTASIPFIYLTARADIQSIREGMDFGADDYIVKPIRAEELVCTVNKRMQRIAELKSVQVDEIIEHRLALEDKIPLFTGKEHLFIPINNIVIISVDADYTKICSKDDKKYLIKKSIKSWENILPDKFFTRVHRNILVNLNYVEKIEPWFNGILVARMNNYPESIMFSKRYSQKIKKMLKNNFHL
jgi:DNA-binding LytR/AlgR family response regulator